MLVVDPAKRYTAEEALTHKWILGVDLSDKMLNHSLQAIRKMNAKRKLRKVVRGIIVVRRMSSLFGSRRKQAEREADEALKAAGLRVGDDEGGEIEELIAGEGDGGAGGTNGGDGSVGKSGASVGGPKGGGDECSGGASNSLQNGAAASVTSATSQGSSGIVGASAKGQGTPRQAERVS